MDALRIFLSIGLSILIVSGLGLAFGLALALSRRLFVVKKTDRIDSIERALPGLNCGICGFPGCSAYAEAVGLKKAELVLCLPGGDDVTSSLSEIMGIAVDYSREKQVTQVHCRGGKNKSQYDFEYSGLRDCNAAYSLFGGDKTCKFGCLGLGSCIKVCPVDAISYDRQNLVWVNKDKCISCGKCIDVCPTRVMRFVPYTADVIVACNSTDRINIKKKYCSVSCIGCKICEVQSPEGGYKVDNYLSTIDYGKRGERDQGRIKCPTSCIVKNNINLS